MARSWRFDRFLEAGGVKLGLAGRRQVRDAFYAIMTNAATYRKSAGIRGCVVAPMARDGVEVIVGTKIDPQFGPVIMFGAGGILVELLRDVGFRVLPISRNSAKQMPSEFRSAPLLNGFRERPEVDREALVDLLTTVGELSESYPRIQEMDLNPVIVHEKGLTVVDARVILGTNQGAS